MNTPTAYILLDYPYLWPGWSSDCTTISDLKAELINMQLVNNTSHVKLFISTQIDDGFWLAQDNILPDGDLYVRVDHVDAPVVQIDPEKKYV